ncbi:MAG: BMP family ABC transporter substrate-binding protein [Clostridia bacterium]|nr:BMP family ABC transporter substrate-binding protein [Clostridia bacterium]
MKMKKVFVIVLALILAVGCIACFTACNKEPAEEETFAGFAPIEKSKIKLGLITLHDSQSTYDKNFIDAATAACQNMGVQLVVKSGVDESDACYNTAVELVEDGCNIIFADSFGHEPYILKAAKEYPNVRFAHATGTTAHTELVPNFYNAFANIYEGRYLAGVAAGMKLAELVAGGKAAKIGYVGAYTYAEVVSGYTSFFLGVKSIVPEVTMDVTFTGSWYDETAEKEAANKLIQRGCVLISQHADSMGAPSACEAAGIPNVTYNVSTKAQCPNTYLVGSRINWAPYFTHLINCTINGVTAVGFDWVGGFAEGSVEITELNDAVAAAGTAEKLAEVKTKLMNKEIKVFDTASFTVSQNALETYLADVDSDAAFAKDTQVIINGYFAESLYRSAPYFDLTIDGINLLDTKF